MYAYCDGNPVMKVDPDGTWSIGYFTNLLKVNKELYEAYMSQNCYAFAIGHSGRINPGDISGTACDYSLNSVRDAVFADLKKLGRNYKELTEAEAKKYKLKKGERMIAFRVSSTGNDYHFMATNGKNWFHKLGAGTGEMASLPMKLIGNPWGVGAWINSGHAIVKENGKYTLRFWKVRSNGYSGETKYIVYW